MKDKVKELKSWTDRTSLLEFEFESARLKNEANEKELMEIENRKALQLDNLDREFEEKTNAQVTEQEDQINKLSSENKELKSSLKKLKRETQKAQHDIDIWSDINAIQKGMENNLANLLRTELKCPVCHDLFIQPETLECGHVACSHCLRQWQAARVCCPVCRARSGRGRPCRTTAALCDVLAQALPLTLRRERKHNTALREKARLEAEARPPPHEDLSGDDFSAAEFLQALHTMRSYREAGGNPLHFLL